jgi:hypothetical protein
MPGLGVATTSRTLDGDVLPTAGSREPFHGTGSHADVADDRDVRIVLGLYWTI